MDTAKQQETITLGGGCFWCLEAVYDRAEGITDVVSGYAGGSTPNPSYEEVCSGRTGHAEVVQVTFDPSEISLDEILDIFFTIHDPTTLNRQGADVGTQYRSAIYYHNEAQRAAAEAKIDALNSSDAYRKPIVTEVTPLSEFYEAEDYHQEYFEKHPSRAYCRAVVAPKVAKFQKHFVDMVKVKP